MMRALNICLIAALVLAAGDVYKIKFESTRQAQRLARLRADIRQEQNAIAALRAQWAKLDNPSRIEGLARRHLSLRPMEAQQYDRFDNLPQRPVDPVPVEQSDPIGTMIAHPDILDSSITTGSAGRARR
jgi:cell division protein FtsL